MVATLASLLRLLRAARVLAQHDALIPREQQDRIPRLARFGAALLRIGARRDVAGLRPGQRLAAALEKLGPSYIKLGQFLATRADVIGPEIAADLAQLQDRLPPFPLADAQAVLRTELGEAGDAAAAALGPAIAAASIAQVHRAVLATRSGSATRAVAIKILRPGVEAQFHRDIADQALAARLFARFGGAEAARLRPIEVVETLRRSVEMEMDLRLEAAAASEMADRTKGDADFRVPVVVWELTAQRVLATEWIEGVSIRDRDAIVAAGRDPIKIADSVIQNFLRHALRDGFFHADMHPGNLFIDAQGKLTAVDFGIMGRLSPEMRRFMAETLYGFLMRDYERVAQVHFDVGFVPPSHSLDEFAQALRSVGEPVFGRTSDQISMARLLMQLFEITRLFDMPLQPQLVLLQKTMVVVEGVARGLNPALNIWEAARPVMETFMAAQIGPEARIREAAEGVTTLGRVLAQLPQVARNLESLSQMAAEGGVKLHPETTRAIAEAEARGNRAVRYAIWLGAAALSLIALMQL